jgi:SNF2 family DNA or RNA helicase
MINRPLAYKGPVDHLTHFFSEKSLIQGLSILLETNLVNWQNISDEKYIKGTCLCDGQFTKQILYWPITEAVGSCSCEESQSLADVEAFPCAHLAALAIESKTRLHRLPPSTNQQMKQEFGKRYIKRWLTKQKLDPFPAMARHRVIYLLHKESDFWIVEVVKAYLTKELEFQPKGQINIQEAIDSEIFGKKQTKFFSLADQQILYYISKESGCTRPTAGLTSADGAKIELASNQFVINAEQSGNRMIRALANTERLFWQSSHRAALNLSARNPNFWRDTQSTDLDRISKNYYLDLKHNSVIEIFDEAAEKSKKLFRQLMNKRSFNMQPVMKVTSTEAVVPWRPDEVKSFDVAKIAFFVNGEEFSLKNLLPLVMEREAKKEFSEQLASYLLQIENLDVLEASYELPLIEKFHFGDREFDSHLSHMLPILNGMFELGWKIEIDKGFRLNQISTEDWYIEINEGADPQANKKSKRKPSIKKQSNSRQPTQLSFLDEHEPEFESDPRDYDWFDLEVGVKVKGRSVNLMPYIVSLIQRDELNFEESEQADKEQKVKIKLDSGETLSLDKQRVNSIFSSFVELNDEKSLNSDHRLRLPKSQFGRLVPLLELKTSGRGKKNKQPKIDWLSGKHLAKKAKHLANDKGIKKITIPRELMGELRDYQHFGLNWLQFLKKHHLGGILADDMGLGKTIQTITHMLVEKKEGRLKAPCLVVAPTSLLSNWEAEARKFSPSLRFMKLAGGKRQELYSKIPNMDLIVTSYGLVLRDINKLQRIRFSIVILDEAQVIKNTRSKITTAVNELRSDQRICLTGTPMENHLGELWSLFQFLMPGFLGSEYQFNQLYRQPIEKNQDYHRQTLLAKRVAPLMLRRTKNEVATELPSKTEMVTLIELEQAQADLYETIRISMMEQVDKAMSLETKNRNQFLIGNALLKLRQVCCHSKLIKLDSAQKTNSSAKINWLKERLPTMVQQGRRILLFSSFTTMLDIIAEELKSLELPYLMLTGKSKHRGKMVEQFQKSEIPIFLISLKAGGVGLNLTAADTVIHYDPWWNPAAEQQANDRAYRIGQDKPVFVYKLITKGTVEEKIQQMQQQKHKLAQGLYDQESLDTMNLTPEDWQALFRPIEGF